MYYDKLKQNLFVDVEYPAEITKLIGDAQAWRDFCALPQEIKEKFQFLNHQEEADPGYRFRSRVEGREDKEYFHIYPNVEELAVLDGAQEILNSIPAITMFFEYGVEVQAKAFDFAVAIGREMGKEIPELAKLIEDGRLKSVLRLLHYTNDDVTDIIADQHFDRSLYTLHLYESGPGLEFLNWNMEWTDAPIETGKTVVFNGYRLEQLTRGKLQKTWHRVARKEKVKDRVSMVLFVWTDAVESYARDARSQDLTPSYNRVA